ncbi:nucleotide exchange factor GrpE [Candidatus Woesearchaeota archaeon]|nr:nucleotide exchange factor GrpE [Candidatus Woesearchaeota archaeon]
MESQKPSDEKTAEKKELKKSKKPGDKEKITELTDDLQRLQAEFENYKKRADKEKQEFSSYAKADLIAKLLPLLDTFEIALRNTKDHEKFVKGMEMVFAQFFSALEAEGLRPINAEGKKFDPYYHEVMLKQESGREEGIVLEELQKGYMFKDKVLRYSKVKISEKIQDKEDKKDKDNRNNPQKN